MRSVEGCLTSLLHRREPLKSAKSGGKEFGSRFLFPAFADRGQSVRKRKENRSTAAGSNYSAVPHLLGIPALPTCREPYKTQAKCKTELGMVV